MNWQRRIASILVILTIIILEKVSSFPDLDRAKRFEAEEDAGAPLHLTPLIDENEFEEARAQARVELPGMNTSLESYAGFLTVDESTNANFFFWFISAKEQRESAPVIVYLEGGPGRTLFFNLFLQHGPFLLTPTRELRILDGSWNEKYNMIYIDAPAGTGFSYMNEDAAYPKIQEEIVQQLLQALKQFFKMCSHFRRNDFYVAGEAMAGRMVISLTSKIHWYNKEAPQAERINLKGMIIGNGFMDPENQLAHGKYLQTMGLIDRPTASQLESLNIQAQALIRQGKHSDAYDVVSSLFALLRRKIDYCVAFDICKPEFETNPYDFVPWVQSIAVRKALHVGNEPFTVISYKTIEALTGDMTRSAAITFRHMLEEYRTLVYIGNLGIACPYTSVHESLLQIEWTGKEGFRTAERKQWRVTEQGSALLAGYVRNYGNLYEVLVRNAGHFPSRDEPVRMLQLLDDFTQRRL